MQQSLVMTGLADVDGFKICMQVCVWLGFPPVSMEGIASTQVSQVWLIIYESRASSW